MYLMDMIVIKVIVILKQRISNFQTKERQSQMSFIERKSFVERVLLIFNGTESMAVDAKPTMSVR